MVAMELTMKNEIQIRINNGQMRYIYNDGLIGLMKQGNHKTQRASHVEPCETGWSADLTPVNGPVIGPYETRQEALDAEVKWLEENKIPIPE